MFTYKISQNDGFIYINTGCDNWKLECDNNRRIVLWHKNKRYKVNRYHVQKDFGSLGQVFRYMKGHMHTYKYHKQDRLMFLLNTI